MHIVLGFFVGIMLLLSFLITLGALAATWPLWVALAIWLMVRSYNRSKVWYKDL